MSDEIREAFRRAARVLTAIVWLAILASMAGCEKYRLDDEVRRLCMEDGGITIYEVIELPIAGIDPDKGMTIPQLGKQKAGEPFAYEWRSRQLVLGNPSLRRDEMRIVRISDGKVLGSSVSYSRIGGDIPGPWQESHFHCPAGDEEKQLMTAVFLWPKNEGK
jgi:hypothetical protein